MLRLFVGIPLPPEQRLQLSLVAAGVASLRWIDPGNYHVTLRFIGEVDEGTATDIHDALCDVEARRFRLAIAGVDVFGSRDKPRTLYAGVDRDPLLLQLRDRVEGAVMRSGLPPDSRRFTPHVTLAQCKSTHPAAVAGFIERHNLLRLPPFPVDQFHLIRSYLTKSGSIYEEVADYPLR